MGFMILIIGGGDGCVLEEVLKYKAVKKDQGNPFPLRTGLPRDAYFGFAIL